MKNYLHVRYTNGNKLDMVIEKDSFCISAGQIRACAWNGGLFLIDPSYVLHAYVSDKKEVDTCIYSE